MASSDWLDSGIIEKSEHCVAACKSAMLLDSTSSRHALVDAEMRAEPCASKARKDGSNAHAQLRKSLLVDSVGDARRFAQRILDIICCACSPGREFRPECNPVRTEKHHLRFG